MKIFLIIPLLTVSIASYAHEDFITMRDQGNIHFQHLTGWEDFEIHHRISILLDLADQLIKEKGYEKTPIHIYFSHDYTKRDTSNYTIGFGQYSKWECEVCKLPRIGKEFGLKLYFHDRDFDIKKMLNLINSAYINIDYIKTAQTIAPIKNRFWNIDTLKSIPLNEVKAYLNTNDPVVDSLINLKTYRHSKLIEETGGVDYFYQNNKFHFYVVPKPLNSWNQKSDTTTFSNTEQVILTVDNIYEIFGNYNDGFFIFIDDSSFYYIPQNMGIAKGMFVINGIRSGRRPLNEYDYQLSPFEHFILYFDSYRYQSEALFIPQRSIVISNYDKLEDDFIATLLPTNQLNEKNNSHKKLRIMGVCLFVLSVLLNLFLVLKIRSLTANRN